MIASGAALLVIYYAEPAFYPTASWFRLLTSLLIEFAVLVEISDHIFTPYPAVRLVGRLLAIFGGVIFFSASVLPIPFEAKSSDLVLLEVTKNLSLAKAAIIVMLLAAAWYCRLPIGKNVSGIMLGFALYLAINVASFTAAEQFGKVLYAKVLNLLFLLSYDLCLVVWTMALWRFQPGTVPSSRPREGDEEIPEAVNFQLGRFNTALTRLLRR